MEKLKLLVVDDEPGIRSGINRILQNFTLSYPFLEEDITFEVVEAATGEDAIKIVDLDTPDIVLLDNRLPGIQGVEVLEYIKSKELDCKVAMITSYPSIDIAVKATDDGASDFIPKPFTPSELKASIGTITKQLFLKRITAKMKNEGKKVRFQFLSVLSHELKSPLNAILGYLDMMNTKQLGDNIDDYSEMIERCVNRANGMKGLIMDMLDLTKIKLEKSQKDMVKLILNDVVNYACDTARPMAIQKDVNLEVNIPSQLQFTADTEDMEIIFNNLVSNAVKYNRDGGKVNIEGSENDETIIISVKDTGIGMNQEDVAKLFQEFVRIKNEKTKLISGSGLGLSIVKKLVEIYGGSITVESIEDEGSTFTVLLPKK